MSVTDTAKALLRLERITRWLYWSGVSSMLEPRSPRWRILRATLIALVGLLLILQEGIPFLVYLGDSEEAAAELINNVTLIYVGVAGICLGLMQSGKKRYRHPKSFRAINSELAHLLGYVKPEHLDLVCRIWRNMDGLLWEGVRQQLESTISQLLLAQGAEEIPLSPVSVQLLKYQAEYGTNPGLRVAALITIKDRNVDGLAKVARRASQSDNGRVRAAARDVLTTMRGTR